MEFQSEKDAWDYIERRRDELRQQFKRLSDKEMKQAIDEIMQLHEKYKSARIAEVCANILWNFSGRQSLESAKESVTRLSELYAAHIENETVLKAYATSLLFLTVKQDLTNREKTVSRLSELYVAHIENDTVQEMYAKSLANLMVKQDLTDCQATVLRLSELYAAHKDNKMVQEAYANSLVNLMVKQDLTGCEETVLRLSELYAAHKDNKMAQAVYAKSLFNLMVKQDLTGCEETVLRLSELYAAHKDNKMVQAAYAKSLVNLMVEQDLAGRQATVLRLSELYAAHKDNKMVQAAYAKSLVNLMVKQDLTGCEETVLRLSELYANHKDNKMVQAAYAKSLVNLTVEQDLTDCQATVLRLSELYAAHKDNKMVQEAYAKSLFNLMVEQDLTDCQATVLRLSELYAAHSENDTVQEAYAKSLFSLTVKQNLIGVRKTLTQLRKLYAKCTSNDIVLGLYVRTLIYLAYKENCEGKYASKRLSELSNLAKGNTEVEWKSITKNVFEMLVLMECDNKFLTKVLKKMENSGSKDNLVKKLWEQYISVVKFDSSSFPTVTSTEDLINRILLVNSVKIIMSTLMMRDLSKVDINHYTSLNNVKFLLQNPNPNKDKDNKAALRLYNATYMNDPEEGKALISYFKSGDKQKLEWLNDEEGSSSVYLCSLTMEEDILPLWTQYGDAGKGACIGFKDDFFDTSTRVTEQTIKMLLNDEKKIKRPEGKKLPLYRVCYVDNAENLMCKGLEEDELKIIENHLQNIRDIITNEEDNKMQEFFKEVVDEIRYLFKNKVYSYEREVRLLNYVPMSSKKDLKLDNRPDLVAPKLYIDYETPILIRKIIFGPKAERTEVLKPYIKYCDPNIEIKHSTIKYR